MVWLPVVWLLAVFLLLLALRRWIEAHLQGLAFLIGGHPTVAIWLFFLVFLPGTLIHELSHWLAAKLLWVPTGRIVIWPRVQPGRSLWLGTVQVGRTDPLRGSLIGLAPLLAGSLVVVLIGAHLQLDALGGLIAGAYWQAAGQALLRTSGLPDFWLWAYLLFAVANRMLPSPSDRHAWKPVLIFLAGVAGVMLISGWTPRLDENVRHVVERVVAFLLYAFSLSVLIDLLTAVLIAVLETITSVARRQRVSY
jgi:hypothetical protein